MLVAGERQSDPVRGALRRWSESRHVIGNFPGRPEGGTLRFCDLNPLVAFEGGLTSVKSIMFIMQVFQYLYLLRVAATVSEKTFI